MTCHVSGKSRKLSLSGQIFSALGLSIALACAPVAIAQAQDSIAAEAKPAVMSDMSNEVLLLDVEQAGDRLVAVGSRGHIVYSDDMGASWTQAPSPTRQMLTSVDFVDAQNGWAVGHDSLILHTSDGGETWKIQYRDPALEESRDEQAGGLLERPLMDVWFRDTNTGFAVGAYGLFLRTDDGGQNWEELPDLIDNEFGFHYNAMTAVKDTGLFLVGEMGTMYRSTDFGDTWETIQDLPYDGSLFGTAGTGRANEVLIWGLRGNMYRSSDFGDSWKQIRLETPDGDELQATLSSGQLSEDGKLVVVGVGGVVVISEDNGRTFDVQVRADRVALATAAILPNGDLLLIGQRGAVKAGPAGMKGVEKNSSATLIETP
ncbi:YCF48-related protein [Halopseudomonas sp.]|uniref:YCF48-related protein n=1 Tax=Halopseudomonas sp. TaxID=2901191 RepID=UPI0035652589